MIMAEKKSTEQEARYTRDALVASTKYRPYCDVLMISLEEGKEYTFAEVDQMVEEFNGRTVAEATVGKE
nr:MAG TPA: hypothetical protein [Caudoviricetes sp.]DAK35476.1 MAG TPA: hypothetical protein [Caudoviricetes sp.]DAR69638.1 MAG TPA: hypothetical protein [Caudoviricetes sp.]